MRTFWQRYFAAFDALLRVGQEAGILTPGDRLPMTLAGLLESFNKWAILVPNSAIPDAPSFICRIFLDGSRARGAS